MQLDTHSASCYNHLSKAFHYVYSIEERLQIYSQMTPAKARCQSCKLTPISKEAIESVAEQLGTTVS